MEDFSFPELNIFLKIIGSGLRNAEILHGFGHFYPHFLTDPEKMINSILGSKDYGGIIQDVDPVFPEFFCRDPLYLD